MSAPTLSQAAPPPVPAMPFQAVPFPARSVPFPADLLDRAMPKLTDTEWRLLCVVVRQTLGWQNENGGRKRRDWLTQDQLAHRAGRSRRAISGAVEGLVSKGMIRVQTEGGEPLDTPEARRGYGGRHWFLLCFQRQARNPQDLNLNPQDLNLMQARLLQTAGSRHEQKPEWGREGIAELPVPEDAHTVFSHAETSHEKKSHEERSHRDAKNAQAKEENAQAKEENAEKNLPTTKESVNKRNGFSEAEPRMGSASEEALSSEKSAYDRSAYAKSAHGSGSAESAYEEAPQIVEEAPQIVRGNFQHGSFPAEKSQERAPQERTLAESGPEKAQSLLLPAGATSAGTTLKERADREAAAGAEYLRQLVEADAVDYDEARRFLLNYLDACRKLFPQQEMPSLAWGREGKLVAELLDQHPYERLLRLLNGFFDRCITAPGRGRRVPHPSLEAFAQTLPYLMAQERPQAGAAGAASDGLPIRVWREDDFLTVHDPSGSVIREGERTASAATDTPALRWHWDKKAERWAENE